MTRLESLTTAPIELSSALRDSRRHSHAGHDRAPADIPAMIEDTVLTCPSNAPGPHPGIRRSRLKHRVLPINSAVVALRALDRYMEASGYDDEHPWRRTIAAALASKCPTARTQAAVPGKHSIQANEPRSIIQAD